MFSIITGVISNHHAARSISGRIDGHSHDACRPIHNIAPRDHELVEWFYSRLSPTLARREGSFDSGTILTLLFRQ